MLAYDERGVAIAADGNQIGAKLHVQNGNSLFSISRVGKAQLAGASTFTNSTYDLNAETAVGDGTWVTDAFTNTSCGNVLCSIAQLVDIDLTASDETYMGQTTGLQYNFDITDPGGTAGSIAYGSHTVASYNIDLGDNASNKPSVTGLNFTKPLGYVSKQSGTHNFNWIAFQDQYAGCGGANCGLQEANHNLIVVQDQSGPGKAGNFYFADTDGVEDSGHLSFGSPKVHLGFNDKGKTLEVYTPKTDRCETATTVACSVDDDCPGVGETCDSGGGSSTPNVTRTYMMVLALVSDSADPVDGDTDDLCDHNRPTLYFRTDSGNEGLWICSTEDDWTKIGP